MATSWPVRPGFAAWKGSLFSVLVDPEMGDFLYEGVDTRIRVEEIVWGGVTKDGIPDLTLRTTVIVGFPGETEADFLETYELLLEADISYLHVFTYSERPDTKALEISPIVSKEDRAERSRILHTLSRQKRESFYERHCGRTMPILFEEYHNGILSGMTENYIRVKTAGERRMINEIENVHVLEQRRDYLMGELTN